MYRKTAGAAFLIVATLISLSTHPSDASGPYQDEAQEIRSGETVERDIAAHETHVFRIALDEGEYLRALVKGSEINLLVKLHQPDGEKIFERSRNHHLRPEEIFAVARESGDYILTVNATGQANSRGRYTIRIEDLRIALPEDQHRVAAESHLAEGEVLSRNRTAESLQQALEQFEAALSKYSLIPDHKGEATALNLMGLIHRALGNSKKAIELYNQALPLFRSASDRLGEGESLNNLATARYALGQFQEALEIFKLALASRREIGDLQGEVSALNNIGSVYWATGEAISALDYYRQTLPLRHTLRDRVGLARTLNNIGTAWSDLGDAQKALESYLQSLPLRQETADRSGEASTLGNIGLIYLGMGEPERSLDYNQRALQLRQSAGDRSGLAYTLRNLSLTYSALGDHEKALAYSSQALSIFRETGDRRGEAQILGQLGSIHSRLDDHKKALAYNDQALALSRSLRYRRGEAEALYGIGLACAQLSEWDRSLEHYRQALAIYKAIRSRTGEAQTIFHIARVERKKGNLDESRRQMEVAIEIIESVRARVVAEGLRASYLASNRNSYEFYIDLLMEMHSNRPSEGYDRAALELSERARARSLIDSLTESRADIRQGVDAGLLAEERRLQQKINAKEAHRIRLLDGRPAEEQITKVEKELQDMMVRHENLQAQIRARSPRYMALTAPSPISLKEIQQLLDDDTLILEYSLGSDRSFLWVVSNTTLSGFTLPPREAIESAARRLYELLTVSHRRQRKREAERATEELSKILIGPASHLLGKKRLLIVADGVLHYIPFAALPVPNSRESNQDSGLQTPDSRLSTQGFGLPLIVHHEIVSLPSVSALAVLRREFSDRKPADKLVAVLADPVLNRDDIRVRQARAKEQTREPAILSGDKIASANIIRDATESAGAALERLPFTRQEAEAIASLAREGDSFMALDFKASREMATSPELSNYRIVHLATHGFINSHHPELSGVVLSLVDQAGRDMDGFLRAQDIYNLRLGAELVVLSACQTALGKQIRGEGLVGLVRGFMYAGSPRVVASLWNVKDQATAELMKRFYGKMLKEGLRPAAALKAAQTQMWQEERWRAPYYWAGFVLQGEWK